jgi:dipeptidase E
MRLLLTSAGIKNTSIQNALVDLLGKPIADSNAPLHPHRDARHPGGATQAWNFIAARRQLA